MTKDEDKTILTTHLAEPFSGYIVAIVKPSVLKDEDDPKGFTRQGSNIKLVDPDTGNIQRAIVLRRGVGDEIIAHEIAHARLGHIDLESSGDDLQDMMDDEVEAWVHASSERRRLGRGKYLRTAWADNIIRQVAAHFLEASPTKVAQAFSRSIKSVSNGKVSMSDMSEIKLIVKEMRSG